jgi:hypothetical protein
MNGEPHARLCGMLELCRAAARRSALIRSESIEGRLYGAGFNPGVSSGSRRTLRCSGPSNSAASRRCRPAAERSRWTASSSLWWSCLLGCQRYRIVAPAGCLRSRAVVREGNGDESS